MPRTKKIEKISIGVPAKAKPTAVPTKGAEHGVASSVAKTPVPKCLRKLFPSSSLILSLFKKLFNQIGKRISKRPNTFRENRLTIITKPMMNQGCWN